VTETVIAIDQASHTLQIVDPSGGQVRTVAVTTPEGQQNMKMIKIGDTITAVVSEAVAVAVEPG
jgi:ribosomal protein L14